MIQSREYKEMMMNTYFAPPERTAEKELAQEIEIVNQSPVLSGLLHSISGLLAVLDEHRQIVALNDAFIRMLGIDDPAESLGLRPGEAVGCIHAHDEPGGCGTSQYCSTCGAVVAIVASLGEDTPFERTCALTAKLSDKAVDMSLSVRSQPIRVGDRRFLLLFLRDITVEEQRAALERTFFHDMNNMLMGLVGASEMLAFEDGESDLAGMVHRQALRLKNEIDVQKSLLHNAPWSREPAREETSLYEIEEELRAFFANHPAAKNRTIAFETTGAVPFRTDVALLLRVLCNMITNALEATDENGVVKVRLEQDRNASNFLVWNEKAIPEPVALRIFQRNFSTKNEPGRGTGTYSMKLFGEKILGGKVSFKTSPDAGTTFTFSLPLE